MWIHNLDPVLVYLGPLQIRYYGLAYLFGALVSYWALEKARKAGKINLTEKEVSDLIFYLVIGVVLGSRLASVLIYDLTYYLTQPWWKIFAVWEGGMAFHGGIVGITIAAYIFCKKKNIELLQIADILSAPLMLALALGRIANFINGELWGTVTSVRWCVIFPQADSECRHPYQIYEAIKRFMIFFWLLAQNKKQFKTGFIFWNFVLLEGLSRFFLDFTKVDTLILGLGTGQWLSILMVGVAAGAMIKNHREDLIKIWASKD